MKQPLIVLLSLMQFSCGPQAPLVVESTKGSTMVQPSGEEGQGQYSYTETGTETETETETSGEPDETQSSICEAGTGTAVGDCGEDFSLPDESGNMVQLYRFIGNVIFLDMSGFT